MRKESVNSEESVEQGAPQERAEGLPCLECAALCRLQTIRKRNTNWIRIKCSHCGEIWEIHPKMKAI